MKVADFVAQNVKMLRNLDGWLDKAAAYAEQRKFELDTLANSRLAPDQFSLARQIQSACDTAKFCTAYLSSTEPPKHPDTETTIAELRARIHAVLSFIESVDKSKLDGAEERRVSPASLKGKWMRGDDYLVQVALPNFYFHVTTAYAILRHNGVDVGKNDFIGQRPIRE